MNTRLRLSILIGALGLSCSVTAYGKCTNEIPPWLAQDLTGRLLRDKSQTFFVGRGSASTEAEARVLARKDGEEQVAKCNFLSIQTRTEVARDLHTTGIDGKASGQTTVQSRSVATGSAQASGLREVTSFACEQDGTVSMTVVLTIPRSQLPEGCSQNVDYPTPTDFLWRSAVLPGWGQFHKGDSATGYTIIITEGLAIPAAIMTGLASRASRERATSSTIQSDRDFYNSRADALFYSSAGTAALAIGVYVFNVLNAYSGSPSYGIGETRSEAKSEVFLLSGSIATGSYDLSIRF